MKKRKVSSRIFNISAFVVLLIIMFISMNLGRFHIGAEKIAAILLSKIMNVETIWSDQEHATLPHLSQDSHKFLPPYVNMKSKDKLLSKKTQYICFDIFPFSFLQCSSSHGPSVTCCRAKPTENNRRLFRER